MFRNIHNDLLAFAGECEHLSDAVRIYMNYTEQMLKKMAKNDDEAWGGLFTYTIPDAARSSTVIYICAIVEQKFNEACTLAKKHRALSLPYSVFNGKNGAFRARTYLEDYAKIDLSISKDEWEELLKIFRLRNFLTHGSRQDPSDGDYKTLQKYAESTKAFNAQNGSVWVNEHTVPFVLKKIDAVLGKLGKAITNL